MVPAIIAGGAALGGALLANRGQQQANASNARMAREQMQFQERMAGSEWQRGVKDMQAAGLNPALAYEKGGNSSPAGATATAENALSPGLSTASDVAGLHSRLKNDALNRTLLATQAEKTAAESAEVKARTERTNMLMAAELNELRSRVANQQSGAKRNIWEVERGRGLFEAERHRTWSQSYAAQGQASVANQQVDQNAQMFPILQEMNRAHIAQLSASAREADHRIGLQNLMAPDPWSARIQANILPFVSSAGDLAGILRDLGIGGAAIRGMLDKVPGDVPRGRIGF